MKHTNEEIINALKVIKDECLSLEKKSCYGCCFYNDKKRCLINNNSPSYWNINEKEEVWRALK